MRFRMDWRSVTFDWNRARAFLVTAEEGSFSAAGRALGIAQHLQIGIERIGPREPDGFGLHRTAGWQQHRIGPARGGRGGL